MAPLVETRAPSYQVDWHCTADRLIWTPHEYGTGSDRRPVESSITMELTDAERWLRDLVTIVGDHPTGGALMHAMKRVLKSFDQTSDSLPLPKLVHDAELDWWRLCWHRGARNLELEISESGSVEWFLWWDDRSESAVVVQPQCGPIPREVSECLFAMMTLSETPESPEPAMAAYAATPEDQDFLSRLLSAPPAPTPALIRLMSGPRAF